MKKRILSLALVLAMLAALVPAVFATTQQSAVNWVNQQVQARTKFGTGQCVDLVKAYCSTNFGWTPTGYAKDYRTISLPSGWTRTQRTNGYVPAPGDIAVYVPGYVSEDGKTRGNANGHVGIIVEATSSYFIVADQRPSSVPYTATTRQTNFAQIWGYIRPNYSSTHVHVHSYWEGYEALHPHKVFMKCSTCGESYYTGATKAAFGEVQYEDAHPHKGYQLCTVCGQAQYTDTNAVSASCSTCNPSLSNISVENGKYMIQTAMGNRILNVSSGSKSSQANIELWDNLQIDQQYFTITKSGEYYTIIAVHSGMAMDVSGGSYISGTNVWQYSTNGSNAQKWIFQDAGNGYVYIKSAQGTYLDAYNGENNNGTNVWAYMFNGSTAQKWKLVRIDTPAPEAEADPEPEAAPDPDPEPDPDPNPEPETAPEAEPEADLTIPAVHFSRVNVYHQDQFTDVKANQWFTPTVASAFEMGLVRGDSSTTYNPYGNVTVAEAITMAARIHSIYTTGKENFVQSGKWYQVYLDYAYDNGIISTAYYNSDVNQKATRAQFAEIFANALPGDGLYPMNAVADNAIPDVKMSANYAASVYKLYRAGILAGSDRLGTFNPDTYITRAEAATILARMGESGNRMAFSMG